MLQAKYLDEETRAIYPNGVDCQLDHELDEDGIVFKGFMGRTPTVEMLLDHVDLKLDWYIPSDEAIKFIIFIRLVLGEEPENDNSKPHYFFADCFFQSANVKPFFQVRNVDFDGLKSETVVLCSREFAKSVLTTYIILFMAAEGSLPNFGRINYGLYVSDSMRNGVKKMMGRLKGVFYESKYLQGLFEEVSFTQEDAVFVRKPSSKKEIDDYNHTVNVMKQKPEFAPGRMKRTFKVDGLGCSTSSRGASNVLTRPQFVFIDDVVANETDARSEVILESIESTIESDIRGGLSGTGYVIMAIGTPFSATDPIYRRVEEGLMLPVVFPRALEMPTDDLAEEDFVSVWPNRHTYKSCRKEYRAAKKAKDDGNNTKMRKLNQEHYLRIASDDERMIPDTLIQWYSRTDFERNMDRYKVYITTDLTTSEEDGCLSAIIAWAVNDNMDWFMQDISLTQLGISAQYDVIFAMARYYRQKTGSVVSVGIETDGNQKAHIQGIKERMLRTGDYFDIARQKGSKFGSEGISSRLIGGSKHWRMKMMLPMFQNRKMYFPLELKTNNNLIELMDEIKGLTFTSCTSRFLDGIDSVSLINSMDVQYPAPMTYRKRRTEQEITDDRYMDRISASEDKKINAFNGYV